MDKTNLFEEPPGVIGLRNLGNSCYLNVIVQCLSVVDPFAEYLATGDYNLDAVSGDYSDLNSSECPTDSNGDSTARGTVHSLITLGKLSSTVPIVNRFKLTNALANLLRSMWSGRYDVSSLINFKDVVGLCHAEYAEKREQDAQEFLLFLLNAIHEELVNNSSATDKLSRQSVGNGAEKNSMQSSQHLTKKPFLKRFGSRGVRSTAELSSSDSSICQAPMASRVETLFAGMQHTQIICPNSKCKRSISRSPFLDSDMNCSSSANTKSNPLRIFPPKRPSSTVANKPRPKITATMTNTTTTTNTTITSSGHPGASMKEELFFCLSLPIPARTVSMEMCSYQPNLTNVVQFTWVPLDRYNGRLEQFTVNVNAGDKLSDVYVKVRQAISQLDEQLTLTASGLPKDNGNVSGSIGKTVANTTLSNDGPGNNPKCEMHLDSHWLDQTSLCINIPLVIVQTTMNGFGSWYLDTSGDAIHLLHENCRQLNEFSQSNTFPSIRPGLYAVELPWQPSGSIHDQPMTGPVPTERIPPPGFSTNDQLTGSWYDNLDRNNPLTSVRGSLYDNPQSATISSGVNNSLYPQLNMDSNPPPYSSSGAYLTEEDAESQPAALLQLLLLHVAAPGGSWPSCPFIDKHSASSNRRTRSEFSNNNVSSDRIANNNNIDDQEDGGPRFIPLSFPQTVVVPRSSDFEQLQERILQCLVYDSVISVDHLYPFEEDFQLTFCVIDAGPDEEGYQLSMANGHEFPLLYSSIESSSVPLSDPLIIGEQLGQASVENGSPSLVRLLVIWPDRPIISPMELTPLSPSVSCKSTFGRRKSRDELHVDNRPVTIAQFLFDRMSTFLPVQPQPPTPTVSVGTVGDESHRSSQPTRSFLRALTNRRPNSKGLKKGELPAASDSSSEGRLTLLDCLKMYTASQELGDADVWHCPGCRGPQPKARLCTTLSYLPDYLFVHLKRFEQSVVSDGSSNGGAVALSEGEASPITETGMQRIGSTTDMTTVSPTINQTKRTDLVDFPIRGLDLSDFVRSANKTERQSRCWVYDLIAVCNHKGDLNSGHYISFCLSTVDGKWRSFDDTRITVLTEDQIVQPWAYVLVYQRRSVLSSPINGTLSNHWTYTRNVHTSSSIVSPESGVTSPFKSNVSGAPTNAASTTLRADTHRTPGKAVQPHLTLDNPFVQTTKPFCKDFEMTSQERFSPISDEHSSYMTLHPKYTMDSEVPARTSLGSKFNESWPATTSNCAHYNDASTSERSHQHQSADQKGDFDYPFPRCQRGPPINKIYRSSGFVDPVPTKLRTSKQTASSKNTWTPAFADNTLSNPLNPYSNQSRQSDV